jgi:hypothetical protein
MSSGALALARKAMGLGPAAVSRQRKLVALAIAAVADATQAVFWPATIAGAASPPEVAIDVVAAAAIVYALGWNWRLALAFGLELVPTVALFPTWTAAVLTFSVTTPSRSSDEVPPAPHELGPRPPAT